MESGEEAGPRHYPQRQRPLEPHDQEKAGKGWGTGKGWETDMERETGRAGARRAWKQQEKGQRQESHRLYQKVRRTAKQRRRNARQDPALLVHPPSKNPHLAQKC